MPSNNRRSFLKLCALSPFISAYYPGYAISAGSDPDVLYLTEGQELFESHRALFNKRLDKRPKIIALCQTEAGVQKAILYARTNSLKVSVKSGGHCFEGFSVIDDGLVIDLSNMNDIFSDGENRLIAKPGVKLAQMYDYCLPKKMLLPAGSCGGVGLAGLTLGGGYGLFARAHGLTCDHLTGIRMIAMQGNLIDSSENPELLWACRGGGNGNFGIVTELRYETVNAPSTLYQHRFRCYDLDAQKAVELLSFWFSTCDNLPNYAFSAFVLNNSTLTITVISTAEDEELREILALFDNYMDHNAGLKPDPIEIGVKYYYGRNEPLNFKNISGGFYSGYEDLEQFSEEIFTKVIGSQGMIFQINTLGGEINNPQKRELAAYPHRESRYLGEVQTYWNRDSEALPAMAAMKEIQELLYSGGIRRHYVNYPDVNITNHELAYFGESLERVKSLKKLMDPENVLQSSAGLSV